MDNDQTDARTKLLPEEEEYHIHQEGLDDQYERDTGTTVEYEKAISATGYGRFHYMLLFLCGWAVSSDAIEVLSVSFLVPSAQCDLHLTSTDKGNLTSIIFVGMIVGGYFWGSLADKVGRRVVLLGSLTVNGLGGLSSSAAQTFWLFLLLRFISGVGVGGSIPVIFSYFTEFQPKEKRGTMISVLATFWMGGNIIAAGLAWIVIPRDIGFVSPSFMFNSWRVFVALCTIPSLTSAALFILMPESPKYLLEVGQEERALQVLKRIHKTNQPKDSPDFLFTRVNLGGNENDIIRREMLIKAGQNLGCCARYSIAVKQMLKQTWLLFKPPMRKRTIVILIINFTLSFGYYGLWMWFPEIFSKVEKNGGSPCAVTSYVANSTISPNMTCQRPDNWVYLSGFMTALSNLPGNLLTIFLMDRLGRKFLLASSMVVSGGCVFFILLVHNQIGNLLVACLYGAVSTVGWNALDVLGAELYPTGVRSTAFGLQSVFGRTGAILGNQVFGLLTEVHCSVPLILVASFLVVGGLTAVKLPSTTRTDIH